MPGGEGGGDKRKTRVFRFFFFLFLGVCLPPHFAFAQASTPSKAATNKQNQVPKAALQGQVLDPGGRAVPGARVSLLDGLTLVQERDTDAAGQYRFDSPTTATYTWLPTLSGFSTFS